MGGPDFHLPDVHSVVADNTYCGPQYLIAQIDPMDRLDERDEWNNIVATPVVIHCPGDMFGITNLKLGSAAKEPIFYPAISYVIYAAATIHNLEGTPLLGNMAKFRLRLLLHSGCDPYVGMYILHTL